MSLPPEYTLTTTQLTIDQIAHAVEITPLNKQRYVDLDGVPLTYVRYDFDIYEITADSYSGFCCVRVKIDDRNLQWAQQCSYTWIAYDHDRAYRPKKVFAVRNTCQGAIADALRFAGERTNWRIGGA